MGCRNVESLMLSNLCVYHTIRTMHQQDTLVLVHQVQLSCDDFGLFYEIWIPIHTHYLQLRQRQVNY